MRDTINRLESTLPKTRQQAMAADFAGETQDAVMLGLPPLDGALGGGFPMAGMTEIRAAESRDWGAACGFAWVLAAMLLKHQPRLGGALVWIAAADARAEGGEPWMPGLSGLAPGPRQILIVHPRRTADALWAAEAAAGTAGIGMTILELRGNPGCFGLTESRRLQFRARQAGRPLLLLRQTGEAEAGAAPARFHIGAAPAGLRRLPDGGRLAGSIGRPAFAVTLEKSRLPAPLSLILEWNRHECRLDIRPCAAGHAAGSGQPADSRPRLSASADGPHRADAMGRVLALPRAS
ncbi:protein ImuA [Hoeflea marina]|uniref:Protein ImuA n=1 Tax=Hoeflea marina TaxID=274592 RepID=A0A317PL98_9HYPH|nr:hypothetical protein [Hoeflea marina]PWW00596.1 protein ImuA [Hoeflea marina]